MVFRGRKRPINSTCVMTTDWLNSITTIPKDRIVVAKSKVDAVESFLVNSQKLPKSILVIHGPSGCGKTCLVRSITNHLNLRLHQIDELIDTDYSSEMTRLTNGCLSQTCVQSAKFPPLTLYKSGETVFRRPSGNNERVIFIDDLEGITDSSLLQLARTLKTIERGTFVLTCLDWFAVCKQCKAFKDLKCESVALNQLAPTFIKKGMEYWTSSSEVPKELVDSGDLRACLYHAYFQNIIAELEPIPHSTRDSNLTMFHALGRLFYPLKNIEELFNPSIAEDRSLLHLYIYQNMLPFLSNIDEAVAILDALSTDDYNTNRVPLVEYTLAVLMNSKKAMRVRPTFTRPEYLNMKGLSRHPQNSCCFNDDQQEA